MVSAWFHSVALSPLFSFFPVSRVTSVTAFRSFTLDVVAEAGIDVVTASHNQPTTIVSYEKILNLRQSAEKE